MLAGDVRRTEAATEFGLARALPQHTLAHLVVGKDPDLQSAPVEDAMTEPGDVRPSGGERGALTEPGDVRPSGGERGALTEPGDVRPSGGERGH